MRVPDDVALAVEQLAAQRSLRVAEVRSRPSPYRTSAELHEVDVRLSDGEVLGLMLKRVGPAALSAAARAAKPAFVLDPARELEAYTRVLGGDARWAPACHAADARGGWVLIERVPGDVLWQVGELETWCAVARHIARMHHVLGAATEVDPPRSLLNYGPELYERFAARAADFGRAPALEALLRDYGAIACRLASLPTTFVHGELYPSNVLVERRGGGVRVALVDWEMAGRGPALIDLAALTSGGWGEEERAAIVDAYGGADAEALELCRLQLAVQWLGWSPDWHPPDEHAFDWVAEAAAAGGRLGLL